MDFTTLGITGVAGITLICYLVGMGVKASPIPCKWIPVICGGVGCLLGIIGKATMPDFPAADFLSAAAVGVASGLAATGVHQACQQLKKTGEPADTTEK